MTPPTAPTGTLAVRVVAMPADTNPAGDIFGGWLMSWMDLAAGNVCASHSHSRVVTIAVDGMIFHQPVKVGDVVTIYGRITKTGRTSMSVMVEAWRSNRNQPEPGVLVTSATFVFVALDDAGRKIEVPPLSLPLSS